MLRGWPNRLARRRATWASLILEDAPARALRLPWVAFLPNGLNYADAALAQELSRGMEIASSIRDTGVSRPRTRGPSAPRSDWAARILATRAKVFERVMAKQGAGGVAH